MKTRYGVSPWVHQYPDARRPAYPRLRGDHTADVIIIGGGLAGCAAAYACAAAGVRPIVVERDRIGAGGSGASPGLLLSDPGASFRDVAGANGLRAARQAYASWRLGTLEAAALLRKLSIQCGLRPAELFLTGSAHDEKILRREFDTRDEAGLDAAWLAPRQVEKLLRQDGVAAVRLKDSFALDPYRACLGLAAHAVKKRATFFERSRVSKVRFGAKAVEVVAEEGTLRAPTVIVATGVATTEFKPLQRHFSKRETYLALTEAVPAAVRKQLCNPGAVVRDARVPPRRLRWTADQRLLLWGGDQAPQPARTLDTVLTQRTGQLMYDLLTMYPAISGMRAEYGWNGVYGEASDGLMYIGPHRNYPRHLFALGGPADSVTGAFLAARMLLRAVQGRPDKTDAVFGWTR